MNKGFMNMDDFPKIDMEEVEKKVEKKIEKKEQKESKSYSKDVISLALKKHGKKG